MKNINVKKVVAGAAALALGVGVLGVAIAGNNNGTAFGSVAKTDVYNTADMSPKVTLVTGTVGDDDAWAQNIANAIASNAKKENPLYASWVPSDGETTPGEGFDLDEWVIGTSDDFTMDDGDLDLLGDYDVSVDEDVFGDDKINVKETLTLTGTVGFDKDKDVKDLSFDIDRDGISYKIEFNPPILDGADDDGSPDFKFKIFGREYTLEDYDYDTKTATLVQNKSNIPYVEGDSFELEGYTIAVGDILLSATGTDNATEYNVEMSISGNGITTHKEVYTNGDTIFSEYLDVDTKIDTVYNSRVTIISGSSKTLELENGQVIEDFPMLDDELWKVTFGYDTNDLSTITFTNYDQDVQWEGDDALRIGDSIDLPFDYANVVFKGLTTEKTKEVTVDEGYINYKDDGDDEHSLFFYEYNDDSYADGENYTTYQTIDDKKLYFTFDTTDGNLDGYVGSDGADKGYFTVQLSDKDGDYLTKDGSDWTWEGSNSDGSKFAYQEAGFVDITIPLPNNEDELIDYGVYIKDSATTISEFAIGLATGAEGTIEGDDQTWEIGNIYYQIDTDDTSESGHVGQATTGGTTVIADDEDLTSMFEFIVNDTGSTYVTAHIDPVAGGLVNTDDTDYEGGLDQVIDSASNFTLTQEGETADLSWAYTVFGMKVEVEDTLFTATIPEDKLYGLVFVGGTTTTGGTEENPYEEFIYTDVDTETLLKKDSMAATGTLIVVGGHLANTVADGITNTFLAQTGDYIVGKHSNGNIYVAGWTKDDTGTAAGQLVTTINGW